MTFLMVRGNTRNLGAPLTLEAITVLYNQLIRIQVRSEILMVC